ncbi:MAG: hypothetical protein ACK45G_05425, partial [Bacteroidota bacterium]
MKNLKIIFSLLLLILIRFDALADLKYHPVSFMLSTDKECYYEGEKITFLITITNNDKGRTLPVLLPHTQ